MGLLEDLTVEGKLPEGVSSLGCLLAPINGLAVGILPLRWLLFQLVIVYFFTQLFHRGIFGRFGLPPITSQLFAGLFLAPDISPDASPIFERIVRFIFPKESGELWQTFGTIGYALSLFLVGVKMDFGIVRKVGRSALAIGVLSASIPSIVASLAVTWLSSAYVDIDEMERSSMFLCITNIVQTHFQVIFSLVSDLELLSSELGRLALSSALISDIFSLIFNTGMQFFVVPFPRDLWMLAPIGLVIFAAFILRPIMHWMVKQTPKEKPVKDIYVLLIFLMVLVGGLTTHLTGQLFLLGAFIIGSVVPAGPPLGSTLVDRFDSFISGVLEPFFVTTSVIRSTALSIDFNRPLIQHHFIGIGPALVSKVIVCVVCGLFYEMDLRDSMALGFLMNAKGLFDLGSAILFRETGELNRASIQVFFFVVLVSSIIVPGVVRELYHPLRKYAGFHKRDIMHCKHSDELQIVACMHRLDNIAAITNLLNISSPTADSPMSVNVLHLIKLAGQSNPVFISHDLQKKKASRHTYSEEVIWAFHRYTRQNKSKLSVHIFTTVSSAKSMHDDICTLALNKLASLIVMPFHRRLNLDGTVDYDDHTQRALNVSVLETAPCSVGVLISRSHQGRLTSSVSTLNSVAVAPSSTSLDCAYSVAVIFIGGADDREAVAFAVRMARSFNVKVDVIRLVPILGEQNVMTDADDNITLDYIRTNKEYGRLFSCAEKTMADGSETANFLKSIVGDFDLVLVGRRYLEDDCPQTRGLKDWSEVPELGVLGDLFASHDIKAPTSVLVIQQQRRQWSWNNEKED